MLDYPWELWYVGDVSAVAKTIGTQGQIPILRFPRATVALPLATVLSDVSVIL